MTVPQVLFVCVHNVGRSQFAAALLDYHAFGPVGHLATARRRAFASESRR